MDSNNVSTGVGSSLLQDYPTLTFFGLPIATHRDQPDHGGPFLDEQCIAAISILFFRTTVHPNQETKKLRYIFGVLLAILAFAQKSYELTLAVEFFSYAVSALSRLDLEDCMSRLQSTSQLLRTRSTSVRGVESSASSTKRPEHECSGGTYDSTRRVLLLTALIIFSGVLSWTLAYAITSPYLLPTLTLLTPTPLSRLWRRLMPVDELTRAHNLMSHFAGTLPDLQRQLAYLLFVTTHLQVGMGYLGIAFLTHEQNRRNELIRMDSGVAPRASSADNNDASTNGSTGLYATLTQSNGRSNGRLAAERSKELTARLHKARAFQRGAAPFILGTALPYMLQIISLGNINKLAYLSLKRDLHRQVRIHKLFAADHFLTAMARESPVAPEDYAKSMSNVVSTAYDVFNRKLFSLPKVLLLPSVMARQPWLIAQVFPFIFLSDWLKASAVSYMTRQVENIQKELQKLRSIRSKLENYDIKNAELLQRSGPGATNFTRRKWDELTTRIQERVVVSDLIERSKAFFSFIQRNFVFAILIDCALANLIALGKIGTSDIFVFSRAIEDAVDMILTRSRGEAEFARMMTELDRLQALADIWRNAQAERHLLHCQTPAPTATGPDWEHDQHKHYYPRHRITLRNLHYVRGTASVRADHIEIPSGVYAVSGANGSGKSTLFRILMSCETNTKPIELPSSIQLMTPANPLTEKDDMEREHVCESLDDDGADEASTADLTFGSASIDASGQVQVQQQRDAAQLSMSAAPAHAVVPKLSITMPSANVVEISQSFYWPLYARPIDWIFQTDVFDQYNTTEAQAKLRKVAEELQSLEFFQTRWVEDSKDGDDVSHGSAGPADDSEAVMVRLREETIETIMNELQIEKDDWFSDLSGGQKSKVELVRQVFLHEHCPDVLLIDETMAPLDPTSKSLVMQRLKQFCAHSVVLVIYHTDVGRGNKDDNDAVVECVPSNYFFDKNLHVEHGLLHVRDTC